MVEAGLEYGGVEKGLEVEGARTDGAGVCPGLFSAVAGLLCERKDIGPFILRCYEERKLNNEGMMVLPQLSKDGGNFTI
jgi:hypothetical protein